MWDKAVAAAAMAKPTKVSPTGMDMFALAKGASSLEYSAKRSMGTKQLSTWYAAYQPQL